MASQTTHFSLLGRGWRIGVMAVMRLGFRYGERLSISRGNVVSAMVFGVLKDEMYVGMTLSSIQALGQYCLPEAWIPDWLISFFNYHFGLLAAIRLATIGMEVQELAAAVIGDQDVAVAVIGGQHGDLGMASQANHFSLLRKGLGIGVMAVMRLGFRYGERLSMSRDYVVSARVFGVLKHEMDIGMAFSSLLALGEYSFPEGMDFVWHLGHYIHYFLVLLVAVRLATIFMAQQRLGAVAVIGGQDVAAIGGQEVAVAVIGGQDVAVAAISGQDDHEIVNNY